MNFCVYLNQSHLYWMEQGQNKKNRFEEEVLIGKKKESWTWVKHIWMGFRFMFSRVQIGKLACQADSRDKT